MTKKRCLPSITWGDITTLCFVEHGGVKYNVNRIDTCERYKQDIALYCKRK